MHYICCVSLVKASHVLKAIVSETGKYYSLHKVSHGSRWRCIILFQGRSWIIGNNNTLHHQWRPATHAMVHLAVTHHAGWPDSSIWLPVFNSHFFLFEGFRIGTPALGPSGHWETLSCALLFLVKELRPVEVIGPRSHGQTSLQYSPHNTHLWKMLDRNRCFANCKRKPLYCSWNHSPSERPRNTTEPEWSILEWKLTQFSIHFLSSHICVRGNLFKFIM